MFSRKVFVIVCVLGLLFSGSPNSAVSQELEGAFIFGSRNLFKITIYLSC